MARSAQEGRENKQWYLQEALNQLLWRPCHWPWRNSNDANSHLITGGVAPRAASQSSRLYGRRQVFMGPIVTLKVFEDNVVVREFREEKGPGRVLVVERWRQPAVLHPARTKGGGARCCASHPEGLHRPLSAASPLNPPSSRSSLSRSAQIPHVFAYSYTGPRA
ncbi:Regulator of ribonuclease-like protein 2 [Hordeum vulgare]|nr:Regulator of ribonuclease-like protein 2 [Hordeum vulgare]